MLRTRPAVRHKLIYRKRVGGAFLPPGMKPRDYLSYYATQFKTVEIDSTYHGTPGASTVMNWYERTRVLRGTRERRSAEQAYWQCQYPAS